MSRAAVMGGVLWGGPRNVASDSIFRGCFAGVGGIFLGGRLGAGVWCPGGLALTPWYIDIVLDFPNCCRFYVTNCL